MRKTPFVNGQFYHIYNRGVDKRDIFSDKYDVERFFQSMDEFNTTKPIGSIYENYYFKKKNIQKPSLGHPMSKLVNFTVYCLNPNHFHFILEQVGDKGIEKFMQRLGNGYTKYFNHKNERSGVLFQGKFKSKHIESNEYLLHVSTYVNLNNEVHRLKDWIPGIGKSSWQEYINLNEKSFCEKRIILGQFKNINEYKSMAQTTIKNLITRRYNENYKKLFLEES